MHTPCKASLCHFYHGMWQVRGVVHGDDLIFVGQLAYLKAFPEHMATKSRLKVALTGPDEPTVLRVLNHSTRWTRKGIEYESDRRHADKLTQELGVCKNRMVVIPAIRESTKARKKESEI